MGQFTAYSLQTSIFLLAGYLIYKWLMASEKQIAFNRWTILGIFTISFIVKPLSDSLSQTFAASATGDIYFGTASIASIAEPQAGTPLWPITLSIIYLTGMVIVAAWSIVVIIRLSSIVRKGEHISHDNYTLVLLSSRVVAPFSWGKYVVMNRNDYESAGDMIIAHELAHIGHNHSIDLLIAQLVCVLQWFNPSAWLLREELKNVHEFQADESVILQGIDARQYQLLLIKKAVGIRFQSIANSLNHSNLKKRITMMYNQKTSGRRRLRGLALVPALALALAVTNLPAVASVLSRTSSVTMATNQKAEASLSTLKVTEKAASTQAFDNAATADRTAQYPGGEASMFKFLAENIKFPEELMKSGLSGRVVVGFSVEADGSLSNFEVIRSLSPEADAEALRVLKSMPQWEPAISNGKTVASTYAIPVSYKLSGDDENKK